MVPITDDTSTYRMGQFNKGFIHEPLDSCPYDTDKDPHLEASGNLEPEIYNCIFLPIFFRWIHVIGKNGKTIHL